MAVRYDVNNLVHAPELIHFGLAPSFTPPNITKPLLFMTSRSHKFISTNPTTYVRSMFHIGALLSLHDRHLEPIVFFAFSCNCLTELSASKSHIAVDL